MDVKLLREATRPEHEATEAAVPLMGADLTREGYVAVLQRFHGVVCAWDTVAAAEAPAEYAGLLRERRRSGSLEADLRYFNAPVEARPPEPLVRQIADLIRGANVPNAETEVAAGEQGSRFLGAMYVLEGSTLGGQYIAHQVESGLKLEPGSGNSFFRGYGKETMPKWRAFQQVLAAVPDAESETVIAAARGMFAIFRNWMSPHSTVAPDFAVGKNLANGMLHPKQSIASQ